jgi:hypothetical protein
MGYDGRHRQLNAGYFRRTQKMTNINIAAVIRIITEKKLKNIPSKGRNQWDLLKQFNGRSVESFIEAAKAQTQKALDGMYQGGNWWQRELAYNLEHGNIELVSDEVMSRKQMPVKKSAASDVLSSLMAPGLYIVTLNNEQLISSRADDKRAANTAVKVNRQNCKFGKAKNLLARRENYYKTFGKENVNFHPLAVMDEIDAAEKAILGHLADHKIRGPAGYKTELLIGIEKKEIEAIAFNSLKSLGFQYKLLKQFTT